MGLFRRRPRDSRYDPAAAAAAVTGFWTWWDAHRSAVERALADGDHQAVAALLGPAITAIHPELTWETIARPHSVGRRVLVVSGGGRDDLRTLAERWRRAGPPDDERWAFHPTRQADPDALGPKAVLDLDGHRVDLARLVAQARADDERCRLDVAVHHPAFGDLKEESRERVAFLALDLVLGEDDVERWLGEVRAVAHAPIDPVPFAFLGSLVEQLADRWSGDRWAMLEGTAGRHRLLAAVRHPLHRVDHPLFDEHVAIRLPYSERTADALPGEHALEALRAFEDALDARLGRSAVLVAHETSAGNRVLHLYGDSTASVVPLVEAMLAGYPGGGASVRGDLDPSWRRVEHLRP